MQQSGVQMDILFLSYKKCRRFSDHTGIKPVYYKITIKKQDYRIGSGDRRHICTVRF